MSPRLPALVALLALALCARADDPLRDYRTPATAQKTTIQPSAAEASGAVGYLGISVVAEDGALRIEGLDDWSPAAAAGLRSGDTITQIAGRSFPSVAAFREWLHTRAPGEKIALQLRRDGRPETLTATLGAPSYPLKVSERRGYIGLNYGEPDDRGAKILSVTKNSPAEKAGLKEGDHLVKLDSTPVTSLSTLSDVMSEKSPGDPLTVSFLRGDQPQVVTVTLGAAQQLSTGSTAPLPSLWKKNAYRVAVIGVEYPDVKMNPQITPEAWTDALFSRGTYTDRSVTGQRVFGSFADFYAEVSCEQLSVTGRVFPWIEVAKKRAEYYGGTSEADRSVFLREAIDKLLAREGKDALKDFDGLIFIYAGERFPKANRGTLYWPHRARVTHAGRQWSYYICPEGGRTMASISTYCHEFGHMLGLPDLYARPENPGSEGVGAWCLMSNQRGEGRPQHMSAWCKEQLGWLKPAVIDPGVKQKLILGPVAGSTTEAFKVLLRPDGSEYLLLENRRRTGFDSSLPAEGLLIWHIVRRLPILEESHGVEGPLGPRVFLATIPYPSRANWNFTPFTTPSSRSQLGGGLPVYLTNIRQHDDGRVSFAIGYEFQ